MYSEMFSCCLHTYYNIGQIPVAPRAASTNDQSHSPLLPLRSVIHKIRIEIQW